MGYLRDVLLYLEPALLPELATYETEIFAGTVLVSILTFACEWIDMLDFVNIHHSSLCCYFIYTF